MSNFGMDISTPALVVMIIGFAVAFFQLTRKPVYDSGIKALMIFAITISIAAWINKSAKEKLVTKFFSQNCEFICGSNVEQIVVSKANGWILDGKYFRKDDKAINVLDCNKINKKN